MERPYLNTCVSSVKFKPARASAKYNRKIPLTATKKIVQNRNTSNNNADLCFISLWPVLDGYQVRKLLNDGLEIGIKPLQTLHRSTCHQITCLTDKNRG